MLAQNAIVFVLANPWRENNQEVQLLSFNDRAGPHLRMRKSILPMPCHTAPPTDRPRKRGCMKSHSFSVLATSCPRLPQELIDMVIDIMRDDPAALKACTLISRAWTKRARDLLLERVYVQTNSSLQHLSESLRKPRRRVSLDDTRELHVHDNHENPFAHIVPHFLAPHTSKISTLCLHDVKWDGLESRFHPSFFDYLPLFTSITCLAVSSCTFRSVCDLERLLAAFPKLNDVNLRDIGCHAGADLNAEILAGHKVPPGSYRRITTVYYNSLTLRDMPSHIVASLCDWFTASPASVDMRSLTMGGIQGSGWEHSLDNLLPRLELSLQHLRLPFTQRGQPKISR